MYATKTLKLAKITRRKTMDAKTNKLYCVTTKAGWKFMVIAKTATQAEELVTSMLREKGILGGGYGFSDQRDVVNIEKVAQEYCHINTNGIMQLVMENTDESGKDA